MLKEIEHRNNCAKKALSVLNVENTQFYNLPCGWLDAIPLIDIGKIIENEIKTFDADTVFTHSNIDANNDHRTVFQGVLQATRPGALNFVKSVYLFEILSSSEWRFIDVFKPNLFIALDKRDVKNKILALNQYDSEIKPFPFPCSSEGIETLAKYRGMQSGNEYAEAFMLLRDIVK